ncbi:hypothetical protein [Thermococcus sp.]|uniref:hypothetical protein n=1 Tax=Thermococcus sp. TaxID=35749 RepID=UPI0026039638|nr:hypothetical protein [Thermococcus sp.]
MSRIMIGFLIFILSMSIVPFHRFSVSSTRTFQAYQITIEGLRPYSIGILPYFIIMVKPYWRVNGSSPGEYHLLYTAYPSYHNITNWTFEYVNLTNLPGVTHRLGNVTLPWPTNNFTIFSYDGFPIIHWQAENGTINNYFWICNYTIPVIVPHYTKNSPLIGRLERNYMVFNGSNTTLKIPARELLKYYPEQFLNDLGGVLYRDVVYIWNSTTASYRVIHREALLIYPLRLSYWKDKGKVYVGVDFSKGVELNANQSIPILLYSKGKLKLLVDVLKLITPQGDPLRNLENPVIAMTSQRWITPLPAHEFFENFSQYYKLHFSIVSNGTSAVLTIERNDTFLTEGGALMEFPPAPIPYLVVNGVPRFLNLSPTVRQFNLSEWWLYEFKFSVWKNHYELLWEKSPPVINSSIAYYLNGTCWRLIDNFHSSSGFVTNGTVEGKYMVFRFNSTTLRIPLKELAKYYPPKVWGWKFTAAKDGKGYLIIPTAGFDYGGRFTFGGVILGWSDILLPVDNSSGVYALYYVNGNLKPVFDLLRLMSPQGDLVRGLPNPYLNSSVTFGLCSSRAQKLEHTNTSTVGVMETTTPTSTDTKEKAICGPGFVVLLAVLGLVTVRGLRGW